MDEVCAGEREREREGEGQEHGHGHENRDGNGDEERHANLPTSFHFLPRTLQLNAMMTMIRDRNTSRADFVFYANRVIRLLIEKGLNLIPVTPKRIETPTGCAFAGSAFEGKICGVSIMRAGESMEHALRECCRSVRIGKILIQRDETTAQPKLYYSKLPLDVSHRFCLLMDPMLATGGTVLKAIEVLLQHGVREEKIIFINLIASPAGMHALASRHPKVQVVLAALDDRLDERNYIVPGLGDFGCRYFGTDN